MTILLLIFKFYLAYNFLIYFFVSTCVSHSLFFWSVNEYVVCTGSARMLYTKASMKQLQDNDSK